VKPINAAGAAKSTKEGIAIPSHDSLTSVSSVPDAVQASRSTPAVDSVPGSARATPAFNESPSPLTTAAPTPVIPAGIAAERPSSVLSGVAARPASSNSDYSSDTAAGSTDGLASGVAPSPAPGLSGATQAEVTAPKAAPASGDLDKTVFDLSDSYTDNQQWTQTASATLPAAATAFPTVAAATSGVVEIPRLFGNRSGSTSYMSLDQLPSFDDPPSKAAAPAEAAMTTAAPLGVAGQHSQFLPRPSTAPPHSNSSVSAASNRYQDTSDDDTRSQLSESPRSASPQPDPLQYVMDGQQSDLEEITTKKKRSKGERKSWIVPPKYHSQGGEGDKRPRSAPPRGGRHTEGLPPRKLSANTAARAQQMKALSPEERRQQRLLRPRPNGTGGATAPTELSMLRSRSRSRERELEVVAAQQKSAIEVQRLAQENRRMHRKFERLEHELQELRFSQQSAEVVAAVNAAAGLNTTAGSVVSVGKPAAKRRSPTGLVARIDRSDKGKAVANTAVAAVVTTGAAASPVQVRGVSAPAAKVPAAAPSWRDIDVSGSAGRQGPSGVKEGWEVQMEEALQHLRAENKKLLERVS
jgi:TolA-binding protein